MERTFIPSQSWSKRQRMRGPGVESARDDCARSVPNLRLLSQFMSGASVEGPATLAAARVPLAQPGAADAKNLAPAARGLGKCLRGRPIPGASAAGWLPRESRPYFFNQATGDSMWEMPPSTMSPPPWISMDEFSV